MIQYRICPHGHDKWKVQARRFLFWRNVVQYHHEFMFSYAREFDTEADAEQWIDDRLAARRVSQQQDAEKQRRQRNIPPRGYP